MDANKVIGRLGQRRFVEDLAESLGEVAAELRERGKGTKGKVTVTFDLENVGDLQITVNEKIKQSLPETKSRGAVFYELEGELHERDPREPEFVYRVVDGDTGEIRTPEAAGVSERKVD